MNLLFGTKKSKSHIDELTTPLGADSNDGLDENIAMPSCLVLSITYED